MKLWNSLKHLIAPKNQTQPVLDKPKEEVMPCFICSTSIDPTEHNCISPTPPSDVFTRYIACHKALKRLVVAIETDNLTSEDLTVAKHALKLS